jgi:outer membrane protein assembly factor BamB
MAAAGVFAEGDAEGPAPANPEPAMRTPLVLLVSLSLAGAAAADNWPRFRGPRGEGRADDARLPLTWSEKKNVVWKTPIHDKGWSSPVVWGDQIWMTTARADGTRLFAVCVARGTGKVIHDLEVFDVKEPAFCHPFNSYASPTPAVEEGRVYVHFGTYGTACLDSRTGRTLWARRDLHCDHFRGPGSSPILYRDLLIVHFDGVDVQYLVALDKASGKTVWKKDRNIDYGTDNADFKKAYGTPSVLTLGGKPQLVSPAASATTAYDPRTGEELWHVYHGGMNVAAPPLYGLGRLFLCTGDFGERLLAVRPGGTGDITRTHIDWTLKQQSVPSRSSPLLVGDFLYMVNEKGIASCVEARTGTVVWRERLGGAFTASPVFASGRIYFFDQDGTAHVVAAGRTWKRLAVNKLDDGCMASPAVAGDALFVRTRTHLYRIEGKD